MRWLESLPLITNSLGLIVFLSVFALGRAEDGHLFIADTGAPVHQIPTWETSLRRINPDGSSASILQTFPFRLSIIVRAGAYALALDPRKKEFYVATYEEVYRTELDGSKREQLNETHVSYFNTLVVSNGILYAGNCQGLIQRLDLSGGALETIMDVRPDHNSNNSTCVNGLAVDEPNKKLYWSVVTTPREIQTSRPDFGSIWRASLTPNATDGELLADHVFSPKQIRLSASGYLYWVEQLFRSFPTALRRARVPPSNSTLEIETVFDSTQSSLLTIGNSTNNRTAGISGFAIDERNQRIWLSGDDYELPRIVEAGLDGANPHIINQNVTEIGYPGALEYVAEV